MHCISRKPKGRWIEQSVVFKFSSEKSSTGFDTVGILCNNLSYKDLCCNHFVFLPYIATTQPLSFLLKHTKMYLSNLPAGMHR